ncbi:hypothetical protein GIB67_001462 [Kingdonia uniflora]|uniref:Agenet domain-containing protein n=1 Tax=Kingdonia uniflora TaxID=39325 RepID=A0A7J7L6V2_9MAGN|nr:hypothetical protein GIB67_001462 [Kingdonia uniflora]
MLKPYFKKGQVEVTSKDEGFRGSWYLAKVLSVSITTKKILVKYHDLMDDSKAIEKLRESVNFSQVRSQPPMIIGANRSFQVNEVVDVFYADGWEVEDAEDNGGTEGLEGDGKEDGGVVGELSVCNKELVGKGVDKVG